MRDAIIIGAGADWKNIAYPCLKQLKDAGIIGQITSTDLLSKEQLPETRHSIR